MMHRLIPISLKIMYSFFGGYITIHFDQFRPTGQTFRLAYKRTERLVEKGTHLTLHHTTRGIVGREPTRNPPEQRRQRALALLAVDSAGWAELLVEARRAVEVGRAVAARGQKRSDRYNPGRIQGKRAQVGVLGVLAQADGRVPRQRHAGAACEPERVADL